MPPLSRGAAAPRVKSSRDAPPRIRRIGAQRARRCRLCAGDRADRLRLQQHLRLRRRHHRGSKLQAREGRALHRRSARRPAHHRRPRGGRRRGRLAPDRRAGVHARRLEALRSAAAPRAAGGRSPEDRGADRRAGREEEAERRVHPSRARLLRAGPGDGAQGLARRALRRGAAPGAAAPGRGAGRAGPAALGAGLGAPRRARAAGEIGGADLGAGRGPPRSARHRHPARGQGRPDRHRAVGLRHRPPRGFSASRASTPPPTCASTISRSPPIG